MSRLRPLALAALAMVLLSFGPAAATASAATKTLSPTADCQMHSGKLTRTYTVTELKHALSTIPTSVRQYTTCYNAIEDQLESLEGVQAVTNGNGGSGGGGSGTVILIVVVVVVILGGGGAAFWAYRRNQQGGGAPS